MQSRKGEPLQFSDETPQPSTLDQALARARRRLMPFLLLMYIIAFLDRSNIAFARNALEANLGISAHTYALAAGLFFISYGVLEIPSNLMLHKVGAKRWLARIMVTWGLISTATLFVHGSRSFYFARLMLGAAEAGFFPGVILYLTYWFPHRVRGQVLGIFYFGAPLALSIGGPVSTWLLHMRFSGGLRNWQWMFLLEGLVAVGVGVWSFWYLDNGPSEASWLSADEKQALLHALAREKDSDSFHRPSEIMPMLRDWRVLHYTLLYFLIQIGVYGVVFYLPSEISSMFPHSGVWTIGIAAAIPWVCAFFAALAIPRLADRRRTHRALAAITLLLAGLAGFLLASAGPYIGFIALCIAASGFFAAQPIFWTFPSNYLTDRAAAAGLALINAVGNLGGFFAPNLRAWADSAFASQRAGLFLLAAISVLAALVTVAIRKPRATLAPVSPVQS